LAGVDVPPLTVKMPGSAEKAAQPASKLRRTPDVAPAAAEGVRLFREGQQALKAHDLPKARQLMLAAWEHEAAIDPETRQMLQDNLQLLPRSAPNKNATKENKDQTDSNKQRPVPPGQAAVERLVADVTSQHAKVRTLRETDPTKAWTQLKELRARVAKTEIDEASKQQLIRRVDGYLNEMEDYVEKNRARIENDERNRQVLEEVERHREMRVRTQQQLAELVEEFNALMDQQRFPEAVVLAKKARELDPLNPVVQNLIWKSQFARQMMSSMMRQERFHTGALAALDAVDEAGVSMEDEWGVEFPKYWEELSNRRLKKLKENRRRFSDVEVDIQKSLKKPVEVHFESAPLSEVVNKLASMAGINVFLDPEGIAAEGVTTDTSVSIDLRKPVSLRSALNLILQPLHLSYIIQDEVLRITSEQVREGDVYSEVYHVADLVIPIPNFVPGNNIGLPAAIREAHRVLAQGYTGGLINTAPLAVMAENPGLGTGTSTASVLAQMGAVGIGPHATGTPQQFGFGPPDALGGGTQADFDTLIDLITTTIEPDSWEDVGGPGAIDGFPTNLSLVVSQTQDVHERIADLLEQLRRLQDLQVTIEVRFITLNDDFFERIGVDFDFNIDDNTGLNSADLVKLDDEGPDITIGLDPNGNPTFDLDIPFTQGSFASTTPTFGGFDANSAANIGFAILSDIEAFFLIQAAQGDTRTNVLQAPKVTLFNGQTAFVSDTAQRPFVTSVIPVVGDFAAAHQPVITVLNEGTSLSVRAVVSNDRRFIRLDLVPFFSKIGEVDTFTFTGRTDSDSGTVAVDPTDDTETVRENVIESMVGTTVQLPTFAFTTVSTTVNVPDGGTILLGGIKRLSEGRNERGVPVLSKVPYVNRLFRNVGIGRETSSLMMMVTPRIIIQEEEEEKLLERTP
jgi:general secretion pathway protein D